jgi:hypothetical protein
MSQVTVCKWRARFIGERLDGLYDEPRPGLTNKQLRRGVHRSVAQLKAAIREFIAAHHVKATPFAWTKSADEVLATIARFAQRTLAFQAVPFIQRTTRSGH